MHSYNYLTADVSHIVIFHWKVSPRYDLRGMISKGWSPWYGLLHGMISTVWWPACRYCWILTLDKSLLCHCWKAAEKAVPMTIFINHFTDHHFFPQKPESSAVWKYMGHSELCGDPFISGQKSLLFQITCRGNLCKNAKERVRECSDAPSTRRCPEPPPLEHTLTPCRTYSYSPPPLVYTLTQVPSNRAQLFK